MECMLEAMLDRYRQQEGIDPDLDKVVARLTNALPCLFAFVEYWFIQPTNNDAERVLHYVVVFHKINGQIKGGAEYMRSMSNFVSCVLAWRNHGKSVAGEVAKLV